MKDNRQLYNRPTFCIEMVLFVDTRRRRREEEEEAMNVEPGDGTGKDTKKEHVGHLPGRCKTGLTPGILRHSHGGPCYMELC